MHIATTGFVSANSGSIAASNSVLLNELITRDHAVDFYTKPSFVDPRIDHPQFCSDSRFRLMDCTNRFADATRRIVSPSGRGLWGKFWSSLDAATYNNGLVRRMRGNKEAEVDLWLGDWAHGRGPRPIVSFVQGPPGSDARSVAKHKGLIIELAGLGHWLKLAMFAKWRLGLGLPPMQYSDQVIAGSEWSRRFIVDHYRRDPLSTHAIPYCIETKQFGPRMNKPPTGPLKLFWLGRFVPRKRLDLMLDGMRLAVQRGCDVDALIVGRSGFVPNYERLIERFPFPNRIEHRAFVPRESVPGILQDVDVICQPSDDEDFGSSVAEALACGVPAIVGATNGTGDYICNRSIQLSDDKAETMAAAIVAMADAKKRGDLVESEPSRSTALAFFDPERVAGKVEAVLKLAVGSRP